MTKQSRDDLCEALASLHDHLALVTAEGREAPDLHRAIWLLERIEEREARPQ